MVVLIMNNQAPGTSSSFREPRLLLRAPLLLWVLATGERMSADMMMMLILRVS